MYEFLTGYMFWLSIGICMIGLLVRFVLYFKGLSWQLDRVAYKQYPALGLKGAVRSIIRWMIPFGTYGWRKQPFMTVIFFGFHIGAVLVPIFLLAHNTFLKEKIGFSLFTLNPAIADILTWAVVVSAVLFALRRIALPEVRILTTAYDYFILLISAAPFITGLIARYQVGDYMFWLTVHIFCGELLLIAIPFTKLSHIALFFASRAQLGMDYGIKRGGMKGKGMAW
ncbi:MAG: respiratory nitrate reductase subunit gamma [Deltaproteobacteria bacterium]|nr:respiratory nitrate reductase subunit gamma [Deltaproteobacteria bacterium]